jgi:threonine/homoserine/homoserine lactone efflux protein
VIAWAGSVALLAFVMAATPGPNNVLFAAAGARQGYLRTVPMLGGMIAGFVVLVAACVAGIGSLVAGQPWSRLALTVLASGYMSYLALALWRAAPPKAASDAERLMAWWHMAAFQAANPKTWLAILAFTSGKLGPNSPGGPWSDVVGAAIFLVVVWVAASLWVAFGAALHSGLGPDQWVLTTRTMAVLAALTVVTFWW